MAKIDVFGMCNPLHDLIVLINEEDMEGIDFAKGGSFLVTEEVQNEIISKFRDKISGMSPGGSGANTIQGIALLGGSGAFNGHTGRDDLAEHYEQALTRQGVEAHLGNSEGSTGSCLVLVTPDAQRTMLTCLGRAQNLSKTDVPLEAISRSSFLYVTAYLWDTEVQKEAVEHAMKHARQEGLNVVLSLSDQFCVANHKDDLVELLKSHVHIVIGNHFEALELTSTSTVEEALEILTQWCDVAVVTLGKEGSILKTTTERHDIQPIVVDAIDTTGAGDMYAAGLLYGLSQGMALPKAGALASQMAAEVVKKIGPRLDRVPELAAL